MDWSAGQQHALEAAQAWLDDPDGEQVFRLFGYAGTGKTTLMRELAAGAGLVAFGAYTGKAALVLSQKGCPASTIHSMIYIPADRSRAKLRELQARINELVVEMEDTSKPAEHAQYYELERLQREAQEEQDKLKQPNFILNDEAEVGGYDLIALDEVSMVNEHMAGDLLSFGVRVLALGDPAQLPPVGGAGYFTDAEPDVLLEEIHRQAKGDPIIDLATTVRNEGFLRVGDYGSSRVVQKGVLAPEELLGFDQILVGRNATRHHINALIREQLGRGDKNPMPGDRLLCLRNNPEFGLLNGSLWTCVATEVIHEDLLELTIQDDDGRVETEVPVHAQNFDGREVPFYQKREANEFDFGWAITTHKAQGSQWPNVLVVDESGCFREHQFRWLYTAITRASESVTISL